jgi:hypothetical protein
MNAKPKNVKVKITPVCNCKWCGELTLMAHIHVCLSCQELQMNVHQHPELARKMLEAIGYKITKGHGTG